MSAPVEELPGGDVPEIPEPRQLTAREIVRARRRAAFTKFTGAFRHERAGMIGLGILVFFVLMALLAPVFFPKTLLDVTQTTGQPFQPPSLTFPLGTDDSGRSVLALVVWGARISLLVGFAATILSMFIGTTVGIVSGHFRGFTGGTLDRVTDWFLVIPYLPLAIVLATILGRSLLVIIVVIGVTSWPGTARIIRSQTLSVTARPYLERSRALGAGNVHQMTRHVLPNVMPLVLANTTLAGDLVHAMSDKGDMHVVLQNATLGGGISTAAAAPRSGKEPTEATREEIGDVVNTFGPHAEKCRLSVTVDGRSRWVVDKTSYLNALTLAQGAEVVAAEGATLSMTVDGAATPLKAGAYRGAIVLQLVRR